MNEPVSEGLICQRGTLQMLSLSRKGSGSGPAP